MIGEMWLMLIEHNLDKVESRVRMRYGVPVASRPLAEVAERLGITMVRLMAAMRKD